MSGKSDTGAEFGSETRWEGYSDYQRVGDRVARSVEQAVKAYSVVDSHHQENGSIGGDQAAIARSKILAAALRLMPEMENDRESVDEYDKMLERWENGGEDHEEGYLVMINKVSLAEQCPGWLLNFVLDIRKAGWELGYLQAGRTSKKDPEDPVEEETEAMFGNL